MLKLSEIAGGSAPYVQHKIYSYKAVIISFFCAIFAMPFIFLLLSNCTTKEVKS